MILSDSLIEQIDFSDFHSKCNVKPIDIIRNAENVPGTSSDIGQLLPYIAKHLTEKTAEENLSLFNSCESLLLHIATIGNPESLLLDFIEEGETGDSVKFQVILKCWQLVLNRYSDLSGHQLSWCFNTIIRYLNDMDLPQDFNLEGKEKALIECDPTVRLYIGLYEEILTFSEFVVEDLSDIIAANNFQTNIVQSLLKLLGKPMAWMDLEAKETKSALRSVCERLIQLISSLRSDMLSFILNIDNDDDEDTDDVAEQPFTCLSLSVFYYLIYAENVERQTLPVIYSRHYVFHYLLRCSLVLLKMSESLIQLKGVLLVNEALALIENDSISDYSFDHQEVLETLPAIMVYSSNKQVRQDAVTAFRTFLKKLTGLRRYTVILNIQDIINQPGFVGFLATIAKDSIASVLNGNNRDAEFFTGNKLLALIKRFATLDDAEKTDLVEKSDTIISVLNLLRFIYLRDVEDMTGMVALSSWIQEKYTGPIIRGVQISVAHYKLEMKNTDESCDVPEASITIANDPRGSVSPNEKQHIAAIAINTLDMIDSLAVRVEECLPTRKNTNTVGIQ